MCVLNLEDPIHTLYDYSFLIRSNTCTCIERTDIKYQIEQVFKIMTSLMLSEVI